MRIAFKLFGFVWALAASSLALGAERALFPPSLETGRIVVAQMECGACKTSIQQCFSPCESMPKSPARKACFETCKARKNVCLASCGGKPVDLNTTVQKEVSAEEARKQTLATRERLVSALPPDIGDVTAILDQQKADPAKAEQDRRTADAEPSSKLSGGKLAEFYARRGLAAGDIGRAEQAVADLRKAVDLARNVDTEVYKSALWDLGHAEGRIGRVKEAIAMREEYVKLPMKHGERLAKSCILAISYAGAGDLTRANARMKTAEDLLAIMHRADKQTRDKQGNIWLGRAKWAKGDIYMVEGRYDDAEQMFRDAIYLAELDLKRGEDEKYAAAARDHARMRLAEALVRQSRLVEAEIEIRKVLLDTLARAGRYSTETPRVLTRFSQILVAQGRFEEAEKLAVAAIETMQAMAFPDDSIRMVAARISVAGTRFLSGDTEQALQRFAEIEKSVTGTSEPLSRIELENNRDRLLAMAVAGDADRAIRLVEQAAVAAKQRGVAVEPVVNGAHAIALARKQDFEAAYAKFSKAIPPLLEGAREGGGDEDYTQGTASEFRTALVLEAYIDHLASIRGTPLEAKLKIDASDEAFRVVDVARGQLVQRAVAAASARAAVRDDKLAELVRVEQDTRKRLTAQSGLLAATLAMPTDQQDPGVVKELQESVARLRKGLATLEEDITRKFPEYARLLSPAPPGTKEVRTALREHEAYISIFVGKEATYVWAVPKSGEVRFHRADLPRERIGKYVEALRAALEPQASTIGDIPDFDVRIAHRLYQQLLEPVKPGWEGARSLLVSTNGALGQLPLSVLPMERGTLSDASGPVFSGYREIKWLARAHAVTVLPSAASLAVLRSLPDGKSGRKPFIGFGNPYFSKEQADQPPPAPGPVAELASRGSALRTRGLKISLRSAPPTATGSMTDLSVLPPLPDTADEVRSLAVTMKTDPSESVHLGARANEQTIKSEDLSGYRIVAFATHGLVPGDLSGLREPALALTSPEVARSDGDGLLTMSEIMGLKLDADWVILSACNTGTGRAGGAESVSGLGRAFFYAGTRSLLVSSWPVETTSARELTTDLFRRVTADATLDRAVALQQAMSALIDAPGAMDETGKQPLYYYAHPIFWAPFILVGDGGGRKS